MADSLNETEIFINNSKNLSIQIYTNKSLNLSALLYEFAKFDLAYMEIFELFEKKFYIRLDFNQNVKKS